MRKEIMQALQQEYEQQRLKNSQEELRRRQEVAELRRDHVPHLRSRDHLLQDAGEVLDDQRLADGRLQSRGQRADEDIGGAARLGVHQDLDRPLWLPGVLRDGGDRVADQRDGRQHCRELTAGHGE